MTPLEHLRAQRKAVMEGTWVKRAPSSGTSTDEACLVFRVAPINEVSVAYPGVNFGVGPHGTIQLSDSAVKYVDKSLDKNFPRRTAKTITGWNDWHGRKHSEVIDVLDYAIKLAEIDEGGSE